MKILLRTLALPLAAVLLFSSAVPAPKTSETPADTVPEGCIGSLPVSAESAILIEAKTGTALYEKKADERLPMASTTKIMTTLLTLESGDLDTPFLADSEAIRVEGAPWVDKATVDQLVDHLLDVGIAVAPVDAVVEVGLVAHGQQRHGLEVVRAQIADDGVVGGAVVPVVAMGVVTVNLLVAYAAMQPQHQQGFSRQLGVDVDDLAWEVEGQGVGGQCGHPHGVVHHAQWGWLTHHRVMALATTNDEQTSTQARKQIIHNSVVKSG